MNISAQRGFGGGVELVGCGWLSRQTLLFKRLNRLVDLKQIFAAESSSESCHNLRSHQSESAAVSAR